MPGAVGRPGAYTARARKPAFAPGWGDLAHARRSGPTACGLVSLLTGRRWVLRSESLAMVGGTERARVHARALPIFLYCASGIGGCQAGVYLCVASRAVEEYSCAASFGNANVLHEPDQLVHIAADPRARRAPSGVDAPEVADEGESVAGVAAGRGLRRGRCAGECPHAWVATPGGRVPHRFTAGAVRDTLRSPSHLLEIQAVLSARLYGWHAPRHRRVGVGIRDRRRDRTSGRHAFSRARSGRSQPTFVILYPTPRPVLCSELISRSAR
jgi:hypothetical protein